MPAIKKDKLIVMFICIATFGLTGVSWAQEIITDEILTGLTAEGKEYLEKGDIVNASKKILEAYEKAIKEKSGLSTVVLNDLSESLFKLGEAVFNKDGAGKAKSWLYKSIEMNKVHIQNIREHFQDAFFINTIMIREEQINQYIQFCIPKGIVDLYEKGRLIEVIDIFLKSRDEYLQSLEE